MHDRQLRSSGPRPYRSVLLAPLLLLALIAGLSACAEVRGEQPSATSATPLKPEALSSKTPVGTPSKSTSDSVEGADRQIADADLSGLTVALDPGHNGGNFSAPEKISRPVPDGRGGTKPCNTTGTATTDDFTEAEFNWRVAGDLQDLLTAAGAKVVLSREDNEGVGPCVDERGHFADDADLLVSIHANGTESTAAHGFHVIVADPAVTADLEKPSNRLAAAIAEAVGEEFDANTAYGKDGISKRPDLAGLNNASVPAVIVECGEMRNPEEAARMESAEGQHHYAAALFAGIVDWA